ncbi:hypothetical protein ZWY2020_011721 [Hordeum vulgare]|nr:hypothetical protein ZWY2020_011721 [Hordeum vulgare]
MSASSESAGMERDRWRKSWASPKPPPAAAHAEVPSPDRMCIRIGAAVQDAPSPVRAEGKETTVGRIWSDVEREEQACPAFLRRKVKELPQVSTHERSMGMRGACYNVLWRVKARSDVFLLDDPILVVGIVFAVEALIEVGHGGRMARFGRK